VLRFDDRLLQHDVNPAPSGAGGHGAFVRRASGQQIPAEEPMDMIRSSEVIVMLLGMGLMAFVLYQRRQLARLPNRSILFLSLLAILAGWFFTNLESVVWGELVNLLEHLCYAANAVLMAVWCGLLLRRGRSA